jgi:hypothetical protein
MLDSAVSTAAWFTKEHFFLEGSQASPVCRSGKSSIKKWIDVERWWDDADRGKEKYWEKHCHSATWSTTNLAGLTWDQTRVSEARSRRPTLWTTAQLLKANKTVKVLHYPMYPAFRKSIAF